MPKKKDEKLIGLLKELTRKIAGKNSDSIVDILYSKKNVNEFKIAKQLKITINQTRNILYKMINYNVLEHIRKKDKRKGWYTYFWTLNVAKALESLIKIKNDELETLQRIIKSHEIRAFYLCPNDNIEMSEETAMLHSFFCPECGALLQLDSKEKRIKDIASKIEEIKKEIAIIKEKLPKFEPKIEVKKVKTKIVKAKISKIKKKLKKAERKARKKAKPKKVKKTLKKAKKIKKKKHKR